MRNRQLSAMMAAAMAASVWLAANATLTAAVTDPGFGGLEAAPAPVAKVANETKHRSLLTVADALGTRLDLRVPAGAARLVIQPGSDAGDGDTAFVYAYDAAGNELLRQQDTSGVVFKLEQRGVLVAALGERSDAPVEIRVPQGAVRVRVESQNYDAESNPRRDGRVLAYDARGAIVANEDGLAIDVLTP